MKRLKFILAAFFLCCANTAYSQILVEEDVDILLNGYEKVYTVMSNADMNEGVWAEYAETIRPCFMDLPSGDFAWTKPDKNKKELENSWGKLLAVKVPPELEKAYQEMGWARNGHRKYYTLFFGTFYLAAIEMINSIREEYPEDQYPDNAAALNLWEDVFSVYKSFLADADFYIIENNKEKLLSP
jgi:hypothetical protein